MRRERWATRPEWDGRGLTPSPLRCRIRAMMPPDASSEAGLSLVELLIVLVIVGILSATALLSTSVNTNAAVTSCQTDAKTLQSALENYYLQNGSYPTAPTSPTDTSTSTTGWGALLATTSQVGSPFLTTTPPVKHYTLWWSVTASAVTINVAGPDVANALYSSLTPSGTYTGGGSACSTYAK